MNQRIFQAVKKQISMIDGEKELDGNVIEARRHDSYIIRAVEGQAKEIHATGEIIDADVEIQVLPPKPLGKLEPQPEMSKNIIKFPKLKASDSAMANSFWKDRNSKLHKKTA